ncbi:MAG: ABC transporter substrate-binding protein [Nitrososphaerales archaeon]
MFSSRTSKLKHAISRAATIGIVVIIIIIIAAGGYAAFVGIGSSKTTGGSTTPTTTSSATGSGSTTTATTSSGGVPSSLTYWYTNSFQYMDPSISYYEQDYSIISAAYEPLLFYNGTSSTQVIPWLASSWAVSPTGSNANVTLRSGVNFQDGEALNSTAVYFTYNRLLLFDGSTPSKHGTQASWIIQQLVDPEFSTTLGGTPMYNSTGVNAVLAKNFVHITGANTFTLNIAHPNAALPYLLAGDWASILAPDWVISHDIALWKSQGYTLPFPTLNGANATANINEYFDDLVATCNTGSTPTGCGATSLIGNSATLASGSNYAPQAGTGPYQITSFNFATGALTMKAWSGYWGTKAHIATVQLNYETSQTTRETDLQAAANAGQAATIDIASTNLYDLANQSAWAGGSGTLVPNSQWAGKIFFTTPYTSLASFFYPFAMNVTNPQTGTLYNFQPFADRRIRLAFADSVNMSEINADYNNGLGKVANSVLAPGLPPAGSYSASATVPWSYNPDQAAQLLLSAMEQPLTHFVNATGTGTLPTGSGAGDVTTQFGCTTLNAQNQCTTPTKQSISLDVAAGDPTDLAAFSDIANTIDNISTTYNMGLTVTVQVLPLGNLYTLEGSGEAYMYFAGWIADYPWVTDFTGPMMSYPGAYTAGDAVNYAYLNNLQAQAVTAQSTGNVSGVAAAAHLMDVFTTQQVLYLYTFYTLSYNMFTTNINPASAVANPALGYPLYQNLS